MRRKLRLAGRLIYRQSCRELGHKALLRVLLRTRRELLRHYRQSYPESYLFEQLQLIDFEETQSFSLFSGAMLAMATGVGASFIYEACHLRAETVWEGLVLVLLLLMGILVILWMVRYSYRQLRRSYLDPYRQFILPFERRLVRQKLKEAYRFPAEGGALPARVRRVTRPHPRVAVRRAGQANPIKQGKAAGPGR